MFSSEILFEICWIFVGDFVRIRLVFCHRFCQILLEFLSDLVVVLVRDSVRFCWGPVRGFVHYCAASWRQRPFHLLAAQPLCPQSGDWVKHAAS